MAMCALLPVALWLLVPGNFAQSFSPIEIQVVNSVHNRPSITYSAMVAYRGILQGAMTRLQRSNSTFNFTYSNFIDYGPFLVSVNGLAGNAAQNTYWELQVKKSDGNITTPDVGIGCYIPSPYDQIILRYTTFVPSNHSAPISGFSPIEIHVVNSVQNMPTITYSAMVAYRGILQGAMTRLQTSSNGSFWFTYTENVDYGPFLVSVNGLAGSTVQQTYWELLARTSSGNTIRPDVGIGCYIPNPYEQIILRYTSYGTDIFSPAPGLVLAPLLLFLSVFLTVF